MILIGQYDSPFVRRVGVALKLRGTDVEHLPLSTFTDAARLRRDVTPLGRVPCLVLDDGTALADSAGILAHLDEQPGARPLLPPVGPARAAARRRIGLALGLADKAVALIYERVFHPTPSAAWIDRCTTQIRAVLAVLEGEVGTAWWHDDGPGHDDIMLACATGFIAAAHPGLLDRCPELRARAARAEAHPAFAACRQDFIAPR